MHIDLGAILAILVLVLLVTGYNPLASREEY